MTPAPLSYGNKNTCVLCAKVACPVLGRKRTRTLAFGSGNPARLHRDTIGAWLRLYAEGGRERLLDLYRAPGKTSRVPPDVLAALRERLEQPDGFASYGAIQTWLAETHGVQMQYAALHKLVAYKLKARPKVVRPRHIKKA